MTEILQMHHQLKARQLSIQCDMNPHIAYPEYILTHLLHALAHHPSFPEIEDGERFQVFEPIYWYIFWIAVFYKNIVVPDDAILLHSLYLSLLSVTITKKNFLKSFK